MKSALRIRFVFRSQESDTFQTPGRQRFGQRFAQSLIEDFAFRYADDTYRKMARQIEARLHRDVRRELRHMAGLFRRHIIGASGRSGKPAGFLTTLDSGDFDDRIPISATIPTWAARSQQYLKDKARYVGHRRWWDFRGELLKSMTADAWETAFGPIRVQFKRDRNPQMRDSRGISRYPQQFGHYPGHVKVAVGTIRVEALTQITPAMLPALSSGDPMTMNSDEGNPGLMALVQQGLGDEVAYRLGRRSSKESGGRYRPTLEPFLAFFLTRSIPNAIANRMSYGLLGRLSGGSAGRTG